MPLLRLPRLPETQPAAARAASPQRLAGEGGLCIRMTAARELLDVSKSFNHYLTNRLIQGRLYVSAYFGNQTNY